MAKLTGRTRRTAPETGDSRGDATRQRLLAAGVDLLSSGGWPAVTSRAVAAAAGANAGLIHYHFGGMPALRAEIAARALVLVVGPVADAIVAARDVDDAVAAIRGAVAGPGPATAVEGGAIAGAAPDRPGAWEDGEIAARARRLTAALVDEASRDPAVAAVLGSALADARVRIAGWLGERRPDWTPARCAGAAALLVALVDGLVLHRLVDDAVADETVLAELDRLVRAWLGS